MTTPNLANPISIIGFTTSISIATTSVVGVLTNLSNSNLIYKINSIFAANVDGSSAADISVSLIKNNVNTHIAKTIAVPADSTQILTSKETYFYLEEGVGIRAQASAAGDIDITISGEVFS